jgi:hypothetical protein
VWFKFALVFASQLGRRNPKAARVMRCKQHDETQTMKHKKHRAWLVVDTFDSDKIRGAFKQPSLLLGLRGRFL